VDADDDDGVDVVDAEWRTNSMGTQLLSLSVAEQQTTGHSELAHSGTLTAGRTGHNTDPAFTLTLYYISPISIFLILRFIVCTSYNDYTIVLYSIF